MELEGFEFKSHANDSTDSIAQAAEPDDASSLTCFKNTCNGLNLHNGVPKRVIITPKSMFKRKGLANRRGNTSPTVSLGIY